jgi:type IV pilus biogenesis protein PilP
MMLRVAVFLVVYLLGCLLALQILPPTVPAASSIRVPEDRWQIAPVYRPDVQAQLAKVTAAKLWGSGPAAAVPALPADEPALTPPDWRIGAVYSAGGQAVAVLTVPGRPDQPLKAGDSLPGGAAILAIQPHRITIVLQGKRLYISTYPE